MLSYLREYGDDMVCVALNFTPRPQTMSAGHRGQWKVLFSTHRSTYEHFISLHFTMYPYEATIIEKIGDLKSHPSR